MRLQQPLLMAAMLWGFYTCVQMVGGAAALELGVTDQGLLYATYAASGLALAIASARSLFPAVVVGAVPLAAALLGNAFVLMRG